MRILPCSIEVAAAHSEGHGGWQRGSMSKLLGSSGLVQEVMEAEWWQPRLVRVCGKLWNPAMIEHLRADEVSAPWDASKEDAESVSWNPLNLCTDLSTVDMSTIEEFMTELEGRASPSVRHYLSGAFTDSVMCWQALNCTQFSYTMNS